MAHLLRKKLGTFGLISNFSFYYAHHMSTIEGGMICTNNQKIYQMAKSLDLMEWQEKQKVKNLKIR